jgi:hypothetical protein
MIRVQSGGGAQRSKPGPDIAATKLSGDRSECDVEHRSPAPSVHHVCADGRTSFGGRFDDDNVNTSMSKRIGLVIQLFRGKPEKRANCTL